MLLAATASAPLPAASVPRGPRPEIPLADLHLVQWTKAEGLPTDALLDVSQTERGYLWVSGFGGLARFDGVAFEVFNQATVPELTASSFYEVLDRDGTLWIASQGSGVWRFENGRFLPPPEEELRASVRSLLQDRTGTLWVGLAGRGAARLEAGRLVPTDHPPITGVTVRDILETGDGALWFATEGRGLSRLEGGRLDTLTTSDGLPDDSVTSLAAASDGGLWVGTQDGLGRVRDGDASAVAGFEGVEIFHVAEDDHGSLWIAAEQGLFRRDASGRVERLASHQGRSLRSINGLAFDHEGSLWVSSYASGLFQLRESVFINWTRALGLASDRVNSVYERRDGTLLIGGDFGAVQVLEDGVLSRLELSEPLPEVRVRHFLEDRAGTLWISSYAGVLRIGGGRQTLLTVADGLPTNRARFVYQDSRDRLWIGTRGGGLVAVDDDGGFEALTSAAGLASDFVLALAEDPSGNLLVGTQSGLSVLREDGGITTYTSDHGLPSNLIFNIRVDDAGTAWIATTGGLGRYRDGQIDSVTVQDGLPSEAIYDVAEDARGRVWLSSSEGVIRIEKRRLEEYIAGRATALEARLFDETHGMADQQCTGGARLVRASGGGLWVPTLGGLSRMLPDRKPPNPVAPPVHISRVRIDGVAIAGLDGAGGRVEAAPAARNFEFSFSALSFQAPSRVEVRYRLEGFDDDWIRAGLRRQALYTGLPPGDYVFRVIGANQDGVWNRVGDSFGFRVLPPYYQTPAFLLLVALAVTAGPWGVYRWRLRIVQRRSARLEALLAEQRRLEAERIRLIGELELRNDQLENLTHAVSHDLKSPLFTIQGFLGALEKDIDSADHERVERDLFRIREAASYMGRLLEQLSKVRRIERTEAQLEEVDIGELAREALTAVGGLIRDRQIEVEVAARMPRVLGDRLQLTEMLQNLIDNAARFTGEQPRPRIVIGWRRDADGPVYFVRDNGAGIEPRHQERVFALFQRLDHRHDGTGVGLTIVRRVVEAHRGRVWVESEGRGKGTTFCFTLRSAGREG